MGVQHLWLAIIAVRAQIHAHSHAHTYIHTSCILAHTCAGEPENEGYLRIPSELLRKMVFEAHRSGWQCWVHAIGDKAVEEVLDALAAAQAECPRDDARHRIEHCGVLRPDLIDRIVSQDVLVVTQPRFISEIGNGIKKALGPDRAKLAYPLRSLLRRGVHLAGSSDRPVVRGAPLLGIHDSVNQKTSSGEDYAPREALTADEALRLFTTGAAFAEFAEKRKGVLSTGMLCDLVVLGEDPLRADASRLGSIPVLATVIDGRVVYNSLPPLAGKL